eukprot:734908-Prorocentrum_lima.AAC.1
MIGRGRTSVQILGAGDTPGTGSKCQTCQHCNTGSSGKPMIPVETARELRRGGPRRGGPRR